MRKKKLMKMKIEYDEKIMMLTTSRAVAEVTDLLVSNDPNALTPKIQEHQS